jgi:hypothetical protein
MHQLKNKQADKKKIQRILLSVRLSNKHILIFLHQVPDGKEVHTVKGLMLQMFTKTIL